MVFQTPYVSEAGKNYPTLAKAQKRSAKNVRATIRKQPKYTKRDIGYQENYKGVDYAPVSKEISLLMTIYKLYEQQQYMYLNKIHRVGNLILSIT